MHTSTEYFHPRIVMDEDSTVRSFAETIDRLLIPYPLHGSLLVIGHGPACPERALFTDAPHFDQPAPGVDRVLFCDSGLFTNPDVFFKQRIYTPIETPSDNSALWYYPASLQEIEGELPCDLTVTTFFRQSQRPAAHRDIARIVFEHTRENGCFMGSGNFTDKAQAVDLLSQVGWQVRQCVALPDPDYSGFAYFSHIGFVATKD